jgi:hypothetical protein
MTFDAQIFAPFPRFDKHFASGFPGLHTLDIPVDFVAPALYT